MSTAAAPTAPTPISGNIAGQYSGDAVSSREIDEAQYTQPTTISFPATPKEELYNTNDFAQNQNGDCYSFNNVNQAFSSPGFGQVFQNRMQFSVQKMIRFAQSNNAHKPVISIQNVDYTDYGLNSRKEYYEVDTTTLQSIKSNPKLKELGYQAMAKPTGDPEKPFELLVFTPEGKAVTGSMWNDFLDLYNSLV